MNAAATPLPVTVAIVTHDDAGEIPGCLAALAALDPPVAAVRVADCGSADDSAAVARAEGARLGLPLTVDVLGENRGYAGGMNAILAGDDAPFVLALNADARLAPDAPAHLLDRMRRPAGERVAAVTPRLVRPAAPGEPRRIDACGMRLTLTWRHLDRGAGEVDRGQWAERPERVFGATGAAALYRRAALDDVAIAGDAFDPLFHSYREDAELCFRFAERSWDVVYEPAARVEHRRAVVPERRAATSAFVNYHSLKNRYLLRAYHQTLANLLWTFLPATFRDLQALAWVLLRERTSLAAYAWLWRHRATVAARRRLIQGRRTAPGTAVDFWFLTSGVPL